jgi:hypothetical protein
VCVCERALSLYVYISCSRAHSQPLNTHTHIHTHSVQLCRLLYEDDLQIQEIDAFLAVLRFLV